LRIPDSKEQLDNTDIHPDQYELAKYIIENDVNLSNYSSFETELKKLYSDTTKETVSFILESYNDI
jgi:transcriptional accessory protein Tex/SPT6